MARKGARTLTPRPDREGSTTSDREPSLAAQSNEAEAADADRYRHAVTLAAAYDGAGEIGADAALYVGRELLRHPDADAYTVAAFAVKSAKQYAWNAAKAERAASIGSAVTPYSLTDEDLALADEAAPDADPQDAYRWTPIGLLNHVNLTLAADLRKQAARLPAIDPETATPLPLGKKRTAEQRADRRTTRLAATAADVDDLSGAMTAREEYRRAASWARYGWSIGGKRKRPMIAPEATPHSGPASALVVTTKDGAVSVDGVPAEQAAAELGHPDATASQIAAYALRWAMTHATPLALGHAGERLPLAKIAQREAAEDKRRHLAAQPVKKPSPRKRPRSGRMGGPATIR